MVDLLYSYSYQVAEFASFSSIFGYLFWVVGQSSFELFAGSQLLVVVIIPRLIETYTYRVVWILFHTIFCLT